MIADSLETYVTLSVMCILNIAIFAQSTGLKFVKMNDISQLQDLTALWTSNEQNSQPAIALGQNHLIYTELIKLAQSYCAAIQTAVDTSQNEILILLLHPPGSEYVAAQLGIWMAGAVCVPLYPNHPESEWDHIAELTNAHYIICDEALVSRSFLDRHQFSVIERKENAAGKWGTPPQNHGALILFTSGTTGKPKGVVITRENLWAHIQSLLTAWRWEPTDRILHVLPLHHTHGIVNALCCAIAAGATCEFAQPFDANRCWDRLRSGEITVFMAVPTIYYKLIQAYEEWTDDEQVQCKLDLAKIRLMVSGSAALPASVFEKWESITGHRLLERYGMTEIGMAIGNPYDGPRIAGQVGIPFPDVSVQLVNETGPNESEGEIWIKSPMVFREYLFNEQATKEAFENEWFKTGDMARFKDGRYTIMGRMSSDIIKSGGFKISALEIENIILEHPSIKECSVFSLNDDTWGEIIAIAIVGARDFDELHVKQWCKTRMASYKIPKVWHAVKSLPKNALGKVQKKQLTLSLSTRN